MRILHRSMPPTNGEFILKPYFIEPNAIGQSTMSSARGARRRAAHAQIETHRDLELSTSRYEHPEEFERTACWPAHGGSVSDHDRRNSLRFSPKVARRVSETRWHTSERIEELENGGLLWTATVAEPREMLPWIRGWGAEVEVLSPPELRDMLLDELRRLNQLYCL